MSECAWKGCSRKNDDTIKYTVDEGDVRYYCNEHWRFISFIFIQISSCDRCKRDHIGEVERKIRNERVIKFNGRYYELCPAHLSSYEDSVDYSTKKSDDFDLYYFGGD